jgi:hypothetical protein
MLKSKRLAEKPYSHLEMLKRERQRERKRMLVIKGLEKAVREVNPSTWFPVFPVSLLLSSRRRKKNGTKADCC